MEKVPEKYVRQVLGECLGETAMRMMGKIPPAIREKYETLRVLFEQGFKGKVIILSGTSSPYKDGLAAMIMKWFISHTDATVDKVNVDEVIDPERPDRIVTWLWDLGLGTMRGYKIPLALGQIKRGVDEGRIFILTCSSMTEMEEVTGRDFMDYLSHVSVEVDAGVPRATIAEV